MASQGESRALITRQEAAALVSCLVNLVLTIAKFVLFYTFVKSVSLKAEAWHSLSDIGSSFVVFLALYLTRRQLARRARAGAAPDEGEGGAVRSSGLFSEPKAEEPPARAEEPPPQAEEPPPQARRAKPEDVVAVGIACLFIVVCFGIFLEVLQPQEIKTDHALVVAAGMLAMAFASHLLYRFEYHIGVESDSPGLIADGYHSKIDMYGSVLVALALVSHRLGLGMADRVIAGVICLAILGHAIQVLAMAARHYLGRPIDEGVHDHRAALSDVYSLTGRWGERVTQRLTLVFARVFFIKVSGPDLGARVGRRVVTVTVVGVLMLYALSGLFACGPGERAFVERFGTPTSKVPYEPGLHYCWPWPIDRVVKVDVSRVQTFYMGSAVEADGQPILWTNRHYKEEFRFLTGDEQFLTTYLAVHFRVRDPYKYLYGCSDPLSLLGNTCLARMRGLAGGNTFFDCITTKRTVLQEDVRAHLDRVVDGVGLEVVAVAIRDMHPPTDVAGSFEAVISAMEQKEALVNRAEVSAVEEVQRARADAADTQARAEAQKERTIKEAQAKVEAFTRQLKEYALADDEKVRNITRVRLYLEMIKDAVTGTPKWVVLSEKRPVPLDLWFPRAGGFWRWTAGPGGRGDAPR